MRHAVGEWDDNSDVLRRADGIEYLGDYAQDAAPDSIEQMCYYDDSDGGDEVSDVPAEPDEGLSGSLIAGEAADEDALEFFDDSADAEELSVEVGDAANFNGISYDADSERLDDAIADFSPESWERLSCEERRESIDEMAGYVSDTIGLQNPPTVEYYNNPTNGDYGGYNPSTNTLAVNEYMLGDGEEAVDTVAHELWHAYQFEHADNPSDPKDYQYKDGFEQYIPPDVDYEGYQDQLVEAEARAFAQQFKDRLNSRGK